MSECAVQVCMCVNSPADVVYGDVPQLFVHGRLTLLARMCAESRLGMFVGHVDLYLAACFKKIKDLIRKHFTRQNTVIEC